MMQDSKGFIWLGTLNGLSYYDGNSFVNIYPDINNPLSLADSRIRSMEEDPNGFMWFQQFLLLSVAMICVMAVL